MNVDVFGDILEKLNGDTTLTTTYGMVFFRSKAIKPADLPCGTLLVNNERSAQRPGYNTHKNRDNTPTVQVDLWCSSQSETFPSAGEDLETIANRVDEVLLSSSPVTNTQGWEKTTETQQFEDDTGIWHIALRYSFRYGVTDT